MTIDLDLKDNQTSEQEKISKKRDERLQKLKEVKKPKKKKIKTSKAENQDKKKWPKIVIIILAILLIAELSYYLWGIYQKAKDIGFSITPKDLISQPEDPELKKDSTGKYTNFMIVGIDTRENSSLLNTDTIVVASYNYDTNSVTMLSIPRDFHVEVNKATHWFARINAVYGTAEKNSEGTGLEELKKTVEEITQQEIQYYAMVDFNAFVEIIDSIGGITVDVENSFIDYMYPLGTGYQTVSFTEGIQEMDGETALKYARSRHSMQNGEGSDYARAARQQKVIIAVKDKILSTETFTNPATLMNLISSVADNIKVSEFTLEDIQAGLDLAQKYQKDNGILNNFVLDPAIGNGKLVEVKTLPSGAYAIGPKLGLGIYTDIHEFLKKLARDPKLYAEEASIRVYNTGLGYQTTYQKVLELQEQYPYLNIVFSGTLYSDKEGVVIYTHDGNQKNHTVEVISEYLSANSTTKPEYITNNLKGEDVTILLGKEILVEETTSEI